MKYAVTLGNIQDLLKGSTAESQQRFLLSHSIKRNKS